MRVRSRRQSLLVTVVLIASAIAACRREPAAPRVLRVGDSGDYDFGDLALVDAHGRLTAQGYDIRVTPLATGEVAAAALARGDVDISNGAYPTFWRAIAKGGRFVTVMEHTGNLHRLVATRAIQQCADLDGRVLALHTESAASTTLTRAYLSEECPGVTPRFVMIPASENRAASLMSGVVSATVLEVSDLDHLEQIAPGRFHVLCDFAARWPFLGTTGIYVSAALARDRPDEVRDYVRARVLANRDLVRDRSRLLAEAARVLGTARQWTDDAEAYTRLGLWDSNGGFSRASIAQTFAFYQRYGTPLPDLTVDRVADFSFLEDVLREIGRVSPPRRR
jgi:ABC-type nitrate/sulfonate/bicarbonate transport system substrate-binding protein